MRSLAFRAAMAQRHDAAEILDRFIGAAAHVGAVVALADRQHEVHLVHAKRHAALGALELGISAETVSSGRVSAWRTTASASASCGSSFGGTNELTSISCTPAAYSASSQAILCLGRHDLGDALQPVAHAYFAHESTFAHTYLPREFRMKASPASRAGQLLGPTTSHNVFGGQRADFGLLSASSIWIVAWCDAKPRVKFLRHRIQRGIAGMARRA